MPHRINSKMLENHPTQNASSARVWRLSVLGFSGGDTATPSDTNVRWRSARHLTDNFLNGKFFVEDESSTSHFCSFFIFSELEFVRCALL